MKVRVCPDCQTSPAAIYYAIPWYEEVKFLRSHIHGGTFIDIGANVGLMTLLVADLVQDAVLFEPHPLSSARAKENLRLNRLGFALMEMALSDRAGKIVLEDRGGPSPVNRTVNGFSTSARTIERTCTTFDQFWLENRGMWSPVSAMKIDVEGHENSVLRGMRTFLSEQRPGIVMFEYLRRTNIAETIAIFRECRYRIVELTEQGARPITREVRGLQDLFAFPEETPSSAS